MILDLPTNTEFAPFYAGYVGKVPEADALPVLENQIAELKRLFSGVGAARESHRYAPGKWSIREVLGHIVDAERVFGFRLFCFARGDQNALPPFDENEYVARSDFDRVPLATLLDEWVTTRTSNLHVLRRLTSEQVRLVGTASGAKVSVRALARILAGHVRHHVGVLVERYGLG